MTENAAYAQRKAAKNDERFFPLWDWDTYFPKQLQTPLHITKDFVESLKFDKKLPKKELFFSLRSLSSAIVECNVRDRDFLKKNGAFKLHGDRSILKKIDELFQSFAADGRMGGREYRCPYEILNNKK